MAKASATRYEANEVQALIALRGNASLHESGVTVNKTQRADRMMAFFEVDVKDFLKKYSSFWAAIPYEPSVFDVRMLRHTLKGGSIDGASLWRKSQDVKTEMRKMSSFWVSPRERSGEQLADRLLAVRKGYYALKLKDKEKKAKKGKERAAAHQRESSARQTAEDYRDGEDAEGGEAERMEEEEEEDFGEGGEDDEAEVGGEEDMEGSEALEEVDAQSDYGDSGHGQAAAPAAEEADDADSPDVHMPADYYPVYWWSFLYMGPPAEFVDARLAPASFIIDLTEGKYKKPQNGSRQYLRQAQRRQENIKREDEPERGTSSANEKRRSLIESSLAAKVHTDRLNMLCRIMEYHPEGSAMRKMYLEQVDAMALEIFPSLASSSVRPPTSTTTTSATHKTSSPALPPAMSPGAAGTSHHKPRPQASAAFNSPRSAPQSRGGNSEKRQADFSPSPPSGNTHTSSTSLRSIVPASTQPTSPRSPSSDTSSVSAHHHSPSSVQMKVIPSPSLGASASSKGSTHSPPSDRSHPSSIGGGKSKSKTVAVRDVPPDMSEESSVQQVMSKGNKPVPSKRKGDGVQQPVPVKKSRVQRQSAQN